MTKPREITPCHVSDAGCIAPAGYRVGGNGGGTAHGDKSARNVCDVCNEPVCGKCSKVWWIGDKRERRCNSCEEAMEQRLRRHRSETNGN